MGRTLQIKRGTTAQNDAYKGAAGELTADMDSKQLRLHDGTTTGGSVIGGDGTDYVVEYATGLSGTNYTNGWYRKYKSGWVEQGGVYNKPAFTLGSGSTTNISGISLLIPLLDSTYPVQISDNMSFFNTHHLNKTTSSFDLKISSQLSVSYTQGDCKIYWEVKGMMA
jgi:hypothetical protein